MVDAPVVAGADSCRMAILRSGEKAEWDDERRFAVVGKLWMKLQLGESCLWRSAGQSPDCQLSAVILQRKHWTRSPTPV